jgi:hypothetical protein
VFLACVSNSADHTVWSALPRGAAFSSVSESETQARCVDWGRTAACGELVEAGDDTEVVGRDGRSSSFEPRTVAVCWWWASCSGSEAVPAACGAPSGGVAWRRCLSRLRHRHRLASSRSQAGTTPNATIIITMASRVSNQSGRELGSAGGVVGIEIPASRPQPSVCQNAQSRWTGASYNLRTAFGRLGSGGGGAAGYVASWGMRIWCLAAMSDDYGCIRNRSISAGSRYFGSSETVGLPARRCDLAMALRAAPECGPPSSLFRRATLLGAANAKDAQLRGVEVCPGTRHLT